MSTVFDDYVVYKDNSGSSTGVVKSRKANDLGLYDMSGNVNEWCFSESGTYRVFRGGSWIDPPIGYLRIGHWGYTNPDDVLNDLGFRLARTQ